MRCRHRAAGHAFEPAFGQQRRRWLGERLRTGLLHINDQTVNDEVINPFGGVGASGNGTSIGGPANDEEFTQWQWLTVKGEAPAYPI